MRMGVESDVEMKTAGAIKRTTMPKRAIPSEADVERGGDSPASHDSPLPDTQVSPLFKRARAAVSRPYSTLQPMDDNVDPSLQLEALLQRPLPVDELDPNTICCMEKLGAGHLLSRIIKLLDDEEASLVSASSSSTTPLPSIKQHIMYNTFMKMHSMFAIWRELHSCLERVQIGLGDFTYRTSWLTWFHVATPPAECMFEWLKTFQRDLMLIRGSR